MASRVMKAMKTLRRDQVVSMQATRRMFSDAPVPGTRADKFGAAELCTITTQRRTDCRRNVRIQGRSACCSLAKTGDSLLLLVLLSLLSLLFLFAATSKVTSVGKPLLGGPWTLVDCDTRRAVTDASFRGKYALLYFGFTHCPDICPNELVRIGDVLDKLEAENCPEVVPLFVTVDPKRDTIAQMQAYKADFHPKFKMLTGTRDQVADITKAYRVYFSKADENEDDDDDYLVDHSIVMYLVGPDGEFLDFFTQTARVDDIAAKIKTLEVTMAKRRNENGQMRREEYEAADDDVSADSFEIGFQRASEESIRKRKIVKARVGSRPPVAKPKAAAAAEDDAAKSNPFGGFQVRFNAGLTTAKPAASSNPFAGFSGLTGAAKPATEMATVTSSDSSAAVSGSYQQAIEGLNKEFLTFVNGQGQKNPSASWVAAVQDYLKYAGDIAVKHASTKPVAINEAKRAAPAPFSFDAAPAPAPAAASAPAPAPPSASFSLGAKKTDEPAKSPATSGFSFGAASKKNEETPKASTSSGFSFGGSAKKDQEPAKSPAKPASGGFSFGGGGSSLFSSKASDSEEKPTPAFSFGGQSKPAASTTPLPPLLVGFRSATCLLPRAPLPPRLVDSASDRRHPLLLHRQLLAMMMRRTLDARRRLSLSRFADSPDDDCTFKAEKAKIFEFKKDEKRWADKGVHPLKVLVSKETKSARILVRNEIGKIVLNSALYKGMSIRPHEAKGKKTGVTLALQVEGGELSQFLLKVNAARRPGHNCSVDMGAKQHDGDEPSSPQKGDFLKLFWTLAESERDVRTQAAAQLLAHLKSSAKQEAEVQYTLKRLVRGLASSRDAARQGFSTALSGLLATFPKQLSLQSTHELLRDAMEVHSSMKPMEQREHVFGRLFGLLALHRSGRLSADLPLLVAVVKELLEMAAFKCWFRETCYEAALTLLSDVPAEQFVTELAAPIHSSLQIQPSKGSDEEGVEAWNADQVLLAVGVQRYLHVTGIDQDDEQMKQLPENFAAVNALQRHNVHLLARPLRGSSGCYPRVHSAWFGVFGYVLNPTEDASAAVDGELFQEAWTVLVENSLVGGNAEDSAPTSHERQGLALKLFELVAPKLPVPVLRAILTPRFQFTSPLSILVTSSSADSDEEEEKPKKKQKLSAGGFGALIELEEKKEREEEVKRRTDRARVWALETMVAALTELLSAKNEAEEETNRLQDDVLRFLVFHSFFTPSDEANQLSSKKNKKIKTSEADEVAQEALNATPALSENVASYAKTRLFSLLSFGLAGADGARASASVLSRIFTIAQDMQSNNNSAVVLREPLSDEVSAQFSSLLLDAEQREDAAVVAADLDKCYAQLVAHESKTPKKSKKNKKEQTETEEESVVVLTDLLLSLLSQDSSALREIVTQVFRSLLPLLNGDCLSTMMDVFQPNDTEAAAEDDDEFAPITENDEENDEDEENEVVLSSADAVSDALRNDKKLAALHQEDLALAAIVGQVKVRSQRKKDLKRARLQTMHFQLRVLDLLQVFVSQRPEQTEAATAKHNALVLSLAAPLFRVLARVQNADSEKLVLRDRLQAVLLHKVLRAKDKIPSGEAAQMEALDALRQITELIRTVPMDKEHGGKVASVAVVYLVRVICTSEASSEEEVQKIMQASVLDAFTKKHSRFPRASLEELLTKSPAAGARVLLEPLAAVAAATEKDAAVDEFSKCEVFRLLTVLLRGATKLQQSGELSKSQRSAFKRVQKSLKTALVRQLNPESVQQLKAKRMKVVMMFALQLVKFWLTSEDKKATDADVRAVVAAVQAVDSKSPVVKGMVKQVSEAAGIPYVAATNGVKKEETTSSCLNTRKRLKRRKRPRRKAPKTSTRRSASDPSPRSKKKSSAAYHLGD
ncbi:Armadillo-type fold [Phytophthora cactorum]|nr:Armadillo-type fold [Phytophthora cactorum]